VPHLVLVACRPFAQGLRQPDATADVRVGSELSIAKAAESPTVRQDSSEPLRDDQCFVVEELRVLSDAVELKGDEMSCGHVIDPIGAAGSAGKIAWNYIYFHVKSFIHSETVRPTKPNVGFYNDC